MQNDSIEILEYKFTFSKTKETAKCDFLSLLPDEKRDFKIASKYINERDAGYALSSALALWDYLFKMRGLPKTRFDISSPVLNFELINEGKTPLVKCEKCKYNFTKRRIELCGAELFLKIEERREIALIECSHIEDFKEKNLPEILMSLSMKVKSACAYGKSGNSYLIKCFGDFSRLGFALAVFSVLPPSPSGFNFAFSACTGGVSIASEGGCLLISPTTN